MDALLSDNLKYNILGRCENPVNVFNKYTGQYVEVPCRKCNKCLLNKSNIGSLLCSIEEAYSRYCYFFTLTYDESSIPRMQVELSECGVGLFGDPVEHQNFVFNAYTPRVVSEYGKHLFTAKFEVDYVNRYLKKINSRNNTIPILFYKDVQLYLKRVRKKLSQISSSSLRYYAVGEYGPVHFRPHWHILFYFTDATLPEDFTQIATECWQYGIVDFSASRHNCSSYVAGYVNNFANVPRILSYRAVRPRAFHSSHFGFSPFEEDEEEVYAHPIEYINGKVFKLFSGNIHANFFNRVRCYFFPRCPRFNDKDNVPLFEYYTFYRKIEDLLVGEDSLHYYRFIEECFFNKDFYQSLLVIQVRNVVKYLFDVFSPTPTLIADKEYFKSFVTRALYFSKRFVYGICRGNSDLFHIRLNQIISYYQQASLIVLGNWYRAISEYLEQYGDDADLSVFYSSKIISDDEFSYVHPIVEQLKYEFSNQIYERTKHRILNDANKIFN